MMAISPATDPQKPYPDGLAMEWYWRVVPWLLAAWLLVPPFIGRIHSAPQSCLFSFCGTVLSLGYISLWVRGLDEAGTGWYRRAYLFAFAGAIVYLALDATSFMSRESFQAAEAGWAAGSSSSASVASPGVPFTPVSRPLWEQAWAHLVTMGLSAGFAAFLSRYERKRREAREQRELARQAQDQALRAKLAPHFIFNTLNTLHAQIEVDPSAAQATTEKLAQLFRQVLEVSDAASIPLKQELAFVEAYLGIEQARLGDRLRVRIEVPEELESIGILPLSIQVLVENAIKHGVATLERGGEIVIGAWGIPDYCEVYVEDPGNGLSDTKGTGTALETLRQRLARPEDLVMGMVNGRHRVGFKWRQP